MTFVGLVGILDPPRREILQAVRTCNEAGISVVMITGDNKLTAEAIAHQTGIIADPKWTGFGAGAEGLRNVPSPGAVEERRDIVSLTGKELEMMSVEERLGVLSLIGQRRGGGGGGGGAVFSRTEPRHKQMIVKLLRQLGHVVAMTGDGVNDAPALRQADIGIAMGITGTEVAKEASAMILADDNFGTIVSAVEEGRSIFNNMKAFIRYLISSNIGEVASIFLTAALGVPEGLAPVQLLWVNLVTDGLPATALGFNPPDLNVMKQAPRGREDKLISPYVLFRYFVIGAYVGLSTVGILLYYFLFDTHASDGHSLLTFEQLANFDKCPSWTRADFSPNLIYGMREPCDYFTVGKIKASTLSLTVLVVIEMLNAFNALSENYSLLTMPPTANLYLCAAAGGSLLLHAAVLYLPPLATIFGVVPLTLQDWLVVFLFSAPVILIDEVLKLFARNEHALRRALYYLPFRVRKSKYPSTLKNH